MAPAHRSDPYTRGSLPDIFSDGSGSDPDVFRRLFNRRHRVSLPFSRFGRFHTAPTRLTFPRGWFSLSFGPRYVKTWTGLDREGKPFSFLIIRPSVRLFLFK